jgi:uncharacterized protein (DUF2062 family)
VTSCLSQECLWGFSTKDTSASVADVKPVQWLTLQWNKLKGLEDSPRSVAVGVAAGIFFGFTPLVGLKTLLAIGVAWLLHGNRLAAAVAVTLHDIVLPLMPVLLRWEYDVGYWVLSHPHESPPSIERALQLHASVWLHWSTFLTIGRPVLLGSLFFSTPACAVSFVVMRAFLERRQRRRRTARAPTAHRHPAAQDRP